MLDAALAEWEADDLADVLTLLTFSDDGEKDELKGGKGADKFFQGVGDKLKDVKPSQGDAVCSY